MKDHVTSMQVSCECYGYTDWNLQLHREWMGYLPKFYMYNYDTFSDWYLGTLLLTWFDFNLIMDK